MAHQTHMAAVLASIQSAVAVIGTKLDQVAADVQTHLDKPTTQTPPEGEKGQ